MARLRIVSATVTLHAYADDGDALVALRVQPIEVPWSEAEAFFGDGFTKLVDGIRSQVEADPARSSPPATA